MRAFSRLARATLAIGAMSAAFCAAAQTPGAPGKVAYLSSDRAVPTAAVNNGTFVFSAPPSGSYAEDAALYQPIAEYISRVTGKRFVYRYSDNWLTYSKNMTSGSYDLVFDGPALNGWRVDRIDHTPLAKVPDEFVFVIIARADNAKVKDLKHLAGHRVCADVPPSLGTLMLMSQFDNPVRRPVITETKGPDNAYRALMEGKCDGTVLPLKSLQKFGTANLKVLYQHRPLPNQAFSAGPRIPREVQEKIRQALLSPSGKEVTAKLREAYAVKEFVAANPAEYSGLGKLLQNELYYY